MILALAFFSSMVMGAPPHQQQTFVEIRGQKFYVDVVRTPAEWQKGLMFREKLGMREGMLFWGNHERPQSFWMKNTYVSLDIIYISRDLRIVSISPRAEPLSEKPLPSDGPAMHVLEILGGESQKLGFKKGDLVKISAPTSFQK